MAYGTTDSVVGAGPSLPATFNERGAYLPFTTPALCHARVRERSTTAGAEIVVPRLIGSPRTHIIPLRSLPDAFLLSVHDRALFEQMMATRATTPAKIARAADRLAEAGLAGAMAMHRQRAARAEHRRVRLRLFMYLVGAAVEQLCEDEDQKLGVTPGTITSSDGLENARAALSAFAEEHELTAQELIDRLERLARVTACVGNAQGEIAGYLTLAADGMAAFSQQLDVWLKAEPEETAQMAEWVVKTCNSTRSYTDPLIARVNKQTADIGATLLDFDANFRAACTDIERLIWLCDGWAPLVRRWDTVDDADRYKQRDVLEELVRYLPLLPNDVLRGDDTALWREFQKRQRFWQKSIARRHRQPDTGRTGETPKSAVAGA